MGHKASLGKVRTPVCWQHIWGKKKRVIYNEATVDGRNFASKKIETVSH